MINEHMVNLINNDNFLNTVFKNEKNIKFIFAFFISIN